MEKQIIRFSRLGFGVLTIIAVITEIVVTLGEGVFSFFNFFGFFTILSNIAAGALLIYLGLSNTASSKVQRVRGAVTLYMLMTGVIFAILLSGLEGVRLTAVPWDNIVLHYIMPVVVVLDWIINPPKKRINLKVAAVWLVFPIGYVLYTLLRGAIVGWYPYPFLNPNLSSYSQVLTSCLVLTVFVVLSAFVISLWHNPKKTR